jgi:hypothetical protein
VRARARGDGHAGGGGETALAIHGVGGFVAIDTFDVDAEGRILTLRRMINPD